MALTRFGKGDFNTKIGKKAILGALSKTLLAVLCFGHVALVLADDSAMTPLQHFRDCDVCSEIVVLPAGVHDGRHKNRERFTKLGFQHNVQTGKILSGSSHDLHIADYCVSEIHNAA